ncbi:MAG: orotate phosphoribosyltransferase [Ruminococcus sp.]|nr:orotate phosphoribosyltransferase [Ruminococcus sp.]
MTYKEQFIKFMVDSEILRFGEFTLKSGRLSPYFINTGNYKTGSQISALGGFYAECIKENNIEGDAIFGPAYKGIPLAITTAVTLYNKYGIDLNYSFDRKEVKDHGEGGMIIGYKFSSDDRLIFVDDVITSGKALRESMEKIKGMCDAVVTDMVISVDRMEVGKGGVKSAVQEVEEEFGIKVHSVVTMDDIISAIENGVVDGGEHLEAMKEYRKTYGV